MFKINDVIFERDIIGKMFSYDRNVGENLQHQLCA